MGKSERAGKPATSDMLVNVGALNLAYYRNIPDPDVVSQRVAFGTSGHRGSSLDSTFTETHILAVTQAICEYRAGRGIDGPLFMGKDTHALSEPAQNTALEVLAANGVTVHIEKDRGFTPTPVISHAILSYNRGKNAHHADGIVITPSHNPPQDGGFKYNPPNGGPADTDVTKWVQDRANEIIRGGNRAVKRAADPLRAETTRQTDLAASYIEELDAVVDMAAVRDAGVRLGVDPLGGSSVAYWPRIADRWGIDCTVVNSTVDPTFSFMTVDHDGKIRMDCSSPDAMASLISLRGRFDVAFGNDPDADRHGIVSRSTGLMNPNHYLSVAIRYLFENRPKWARSAMIGKTVVSSAVIDRVAARLERRLFEVPVGFKWFVDGLFTGELGFGGEESAGASFLRMDGRPWSTDKDGIILNLLSAEMIARTGRDPGEIYRSIEESEGRSFYRRVDAPISREEKERFKTLNADSVTARTLAGDEIIARLTAAPGNGAPIGGLKITTSGGWFAARPSGTEDIYKIYAESFKTDEHLAQILSEARDIVGAVLRAPV